MTLGCQWCLLVERAAQWANVTVMALESLQQELIRLMPEENQESTSELIEALEDVEALIVLEEIRAAELAPREGVFEVRVRWVAP